MLTLSVQQHNVYSTVWADIGSYIGYPEDSRLKTRREKDYGGRSASEVDFICKRLKISVNAKCLAAQRILDSMG